MTKKSSTPAIRFKGFTDTWEQRKLNEVVNVYDGVHQTPDYKDSGVMFLSVENISTLKSEKYISEEAFQRDYKVYPQKGDILMTRIGDVGTPNVVETTEKVAFYVSLALLKPTKINSYFLCNSIQSPLFQKGLKDRTLVTAIPQKINKDEIGKVNIILPTSSQEQQLIGEYFRNLDHLITLHQRKYDKLTNVKKSMLEKMFPKNGSNVPEIRFKGFTEAWEQRKFEEIAVRSSVICSDDTLPRVEYEDIVSGTGRLNKDIYAKQSSKSGIAFHQGDVLYGKLRPYLQNWLLPTFDGLAVGDFWVLQPQNADSSFLYRLIQSRQFDEVANQSTGTKMPRADWKLVSKTVFSIPSNISEQAAIGTYFTALDSLITLHQRELEKLKNLKKACLEKMFV